MTQEYPLLDRYLEKTETLIWKDTCTPVFTAALFTVAKICKQSKCPSVDEWIMIYIHGMKVNVKVKLLSRVRLFATPRTDYSLPGSSVHGIFQARILPGVGYHFLE